MPIKLSSKIEVPAKEFDLVWIKSINIVCPELDGKVSARVIGQPYNDKGEVLHQEISLSWEDIEAEAKSNPKIAEATALILSCVQDKLGEV